MKYNDEFTAVRSFLIGLGADIRVIYYPGCGTDTAPSKMFPEARVIYVDCDKGEVEKLQALGFEVYQADSDFFVPDSPVDLLFLRNSNLNDLSNIPRLDGFVVSNDWGGGFATRLWRDGRFEHIARIDELQGNMIISTSDLHLHWETVETDEELRVVSDFDWFERQVIYELGQRPASVVSAYKELLEQGKMRMGLPRKRGGANNFYIFRRR